MRGNAARDLLYSPVVCVIRTRRGCASIDVRLPAFGIVSVSMCAIARAVPAGIVNVIHAVHRRDLIVLDAARLCDHYILKLAASRHCIPHASPVAPTVIRITPAPGAPTTSGCKPTKRVITERLVTRRAVDRAAH